MLKQEKIFEELQSIESFAEMLLEKCYSVRQLLSLGGLHPRASFKKKSQSKINQAVANRNKSITRKAKKILIALLLFSAGVTAQDLSVPSYDSLCSCIDSYYGELAGAETNEFNQQRKGRWLNYVPSPGYSPFTGGFSLSLNLSAPLQEAKARRQAVLKIQSITRTYFLATSQLKQQVKADIKVLQNSIFEVRLSDSLEYLKDKAFNLVKHQYDRNEITPTEFIARQIDYMTYKASRISTVNAIKQKIFELLLKYKCPVP